MRVARELPMIWVQASEDGEILVPEARERLRGVFFLRFAGQVFGISIAAL
jgi:hypothetical protein